MRLKTIEVLLPVFGISTVMLAHYLPGMWGIFSYAPLGVFQWLCFEYGAMVERGDR